MPAEIDRPREWHVILFQGHDFVILRHYAILAPGEDLTEQVPEQRLTREEWRQHHAEFGLDRYGQPLEAEAARRETVRRSL